MGVLTLLKENLSHSEGMPRFEESLQTPSNVIMLIFPMMILKFSSKEDRKRTL